jgi:hypothetical protein
MQHYQNRYNQISVSNHLAITGMYKLHMHIALCHNANNFTVPVSSETQFSSHVLTEALTHMNTTHMTMF